jgi:hypothetical protein
MLRRRLRKPFSGGAVKRFNGIGLPIERGNITIHANRQSVKGFARRTLTASVKKGTSRLRDGFPQGREIDAQFIPIFVSSKWPHLSSNDSHYATMKRIRLRSVQWRSYRLAAAVSKSRREPARGADRPFVSPSRGSNCRTIYRLMLDLYFDARHMVPDHQLVEVGFRRRGDLNSNRKTFLWRDSFDASRSRLPPSAADSRELISSIKTQKTRRATSF